MKKILLAILVLVLLSSQVFAAACLDEIKSTSTSGFLAELPSLNSRLGVSCDNSVPSPADRFLKNGVISVKLFMKGSSTEHFSINTKDGKIVRLDNFGANKPTFIVGLGECEFDTILRSQNKVGIISYLYLQNKVQITAVGFWNKIKFSVTKLFIKSIFKQLQSPENIACSTADGAA